MAGAAESEYGWACHQRPGREHAEQEELPGLAPTGARAAADQVDGGRAGAEGHDGRARAKGERGP